MTCSRIVQRWVLAAVLITWTGGHLGPTPALAQTARKTLTGVGAGYAVTPRQAAFGYSIVFSSNPRGTEGALRVVFDPALSGIREISSNRFDAVIVEGGEVQVSLRAEVLRDDSTRQPTPIFTSTRITFGASEINISLPDLNVTTGDAEVYLGGNAVSSDPVSALQFGLAPGVDSDGNGLLIMFATALAEDEDRAGRRMKGEVFGSLVVLDDNGIAVEAAPESVEVLLDGPFVRKLHFGGAATVADFVMQTTCEGDLDFVADADANGPTVFTIDVDPCGVIQGAADRPRTKPKLLGTLKIAG